MLHRKGAATLAACAALACAGIVRAESTGSESQDGVVLHPTYFQETTTAPATEPTTAPASQPAAPAPKPLMAGLTAIGIGKPLSDANITIGGWVAGSYTVSANGDSPHIPMAGRFFDTKNNRAVLNQIDLFIDRPVDYGKAAQNHTIDIGGHLELGYGWDFGLLHSSGIFDNPATLGVTDGYYASRDHPENQFDILQAYLDFALPLGSGLRIRAGKFVTLLGYEVIAPTQNAFYSHSFLFSFAIPLTQTGVMGEYKLSDDWLIDAGITRGWNQSLNDNNGDPDFLGGVTFTPQASDFLKKWKFILNASLGPQGTNDNSNWWTVLDFQAIYTATDKLTLAVNADYGDAPHAPGVMGAAQWYGIAGYAAYTLNDYLTPNLRLEYYGDTKGFTLGVPAGSPAGTLPMGQNLYEATVNVNIKPFPSDAIGQNLVIRPEVRLDYSEHRFFKSSTHYDQFTFGIDAYFTF
ncbi:MAG TPA: porin [Tepidisphaeraceae bacterium]|jgi:hypothetical protein